MVELRLALVVILLLILNVITSIKHSNYYKKTVNEILKEKDNGYLGIGMTQSAFKARSIVLLVANRKGIIEECQVMTGLTIFAKFKRYSGIEGYDIGSIPEKYFSVRHGEALQQSIEFIKKQKNSSDTLEGTK